MSKEIPENIIVEDINHKRDSSVEREENRAAQWHNRKSLSEQMENIKICRKTM